MAIKVTVGEQKTQEKEFPKIMKHTYNSNNVCILFMSNKNNGIVLNCIRTSEIISGDKIGDIWENVDTDEDGWEDCNEPITLQNT